MRAFLGTLLSGSNQALLGQLVTTLVDGHPNVLRPIPHASAHLTYAFFAFLDERQQEKVKHAMEATASRHLPIEIRLGKPRVLAAGRAPRLICADLTLGLEAVRHLGHDLFETLGRALPGTAISPMKTAHVTLARFHRRASRSDAAAVRATLAEAPFAEATAGDGIDRIQLIASTLGPKGPIYTVVSTSSLV